MEFTTDRPYVRPHEIHFPHALVFDPFRVDLPKIQNPSAIYSVTMGSMSVIDKPSCGEVYGHRLILIDATETSRSSGFFDFVLKNLTQVLPANYTDFAIATFSDTLTFLTQGPSITVFPANEPIPIPPSVYLNAIPESLHPLQEMINENKVPILDILENVISSIGNYGEIYLLTANLPIDEGLQTEQAIFDFLTVKKVKLDPRMAKIQQILQQRHLALNIGLYEPLKTTFTQMETVLLATCSRLVVLDPTPGCICTLRDFFSTFIAKSIINNSSDHLVLDYSIGPKNYDHCEFHHLGGEVSVFEFFIDDLSESTISFDSITHYRLPSGESRVRFISKQLNMTNSPLESFQNANSLALARYLIYDTISVYFKLHVSVKALTSNALKRMVAFLAPSNQSRTKLDIQPSMRNLPSYLLGGLKTPAFSCATSFSDRISHLFEITRHSFTFGEYCCPYMLDLTENASIPTTPSKEELHEGHIYTLFDGLDTWVYLNTRNEQVNQELVALFEKNQRSHEHVSSALVFSLRSVIKGRCFFCIPMKMRDQLFKDRLYIDQSTYSLSIHQWLGVIKMEMLTLFNPEEKK